MHFAATPATDVAAIRHTRRATQKRFVRAKLIPVHEAAVHEGGIITHQGAACGIRASCESVWSEARTRDHKTATALAGLDGVTHTSGVPLSAAAIRVIPADCRAAHGVIAVRLRVLFNATPSATVAATWCRAAVDARQCRARRIPCDGAAGIVNRANAGAAGFIVAPCVGVLFKATAEARAGPTRSRHTVQASARDTVHIPARSAADWVEPADDVATGWIIAARRRVRDAALSAAGAARNGVADALCDINAVGVPSELAAVGLDLANSRAAEFVRASRLWVHEIWVAAIGAIGWSIAEVRCIRRASFIPCARAAGWVKVADERATARVGTACDSARHAARSGEEGAARAADLAHAVRVDHAEHVPLQFAAARIKGAHGVAALGVVATRAKVRIEATFALDVSTAVAVRCGKVRASGIPFEGAASVVDDADLLTAARFVAACGVVAHIATAVGIGATGHEDRAHRLCLARAGVVPLNHAAESVDGADIVATTEVIAPDTRMCRLAGASGWIAAGALRESTIVVRDLRAVEVPPVFAAVLISRADEFAAGCVAAVGASVLVTAASRVWVPTIWTELVRPIDADLIPCGFTAVRIHGAHGRTAIGIIASRCFVRDFATPSTWRSTTNATGPRCCR